MNAGSTRRSSLLQFLRFGVVGVAGLLVDLAVLFLLAPLLGWYAARVLSFLAAASATWWLNRRFTFVEAGAAPRTSIGQEYLRYLGSMLGGAVLNYGAYLLVLHWIGGSLGATLGVMAGSCAGLFSNFFAARHLVFRPARAGSMRALADWPLADRKRIRGVFTDIDDTLTTDGAITPDALQALADLKAAGLQVIAITGRPVGWSESFAATWPIDAIVAENGAVALVPASAPAPSGPTGLSKRYQQDIATRTANHARMQEVLERIEREIPGARRATDSPGRECDIAIDHSEFVHLDESQIAAVVALMRSEGLHATVSSIHINAWFGEHNKLEGARWILRELTGRTLDDEMDRWAYVGDSTNDQLMFQAFDNSIGVANVARFVPKLQHLPRYVTLGERGAGFTEAARAVLAAR
jgi:HAD superfamily hydrolase (TIGR01484 family)